MKLNLLASWTLRVTLMMALAVGLPAAAMAKGGVSKTSKPADNHEEIELFAAMASGDIEVELIPKDASKSTIRFTNKSGKPVSVKLPEAFAGVPVLAQIGGFGGGGLGGGGLGGGGFGGGGFGGGGGGGNQGFGGGFGGGGGGLGGGGLGGGGFGGGGLGGGFMNLAAEKVGTVRVNTFCLEHGKKDPNPHIKYELRPIEQFTDNKEVAEVCRMLATGELPQNTAQAAAWNLMDGLTWQELAAKDKVRRSNGYVEKWFSYDELALAQRAVAVAAERAKIRAEQQSEPSSPGEAYNQ